MVIRICYTLDYIIAYTLSYILAYTLVNTLYYTPRKYVHTRRISHVYLLVGARPRCHPCRASWAAPPMF